MAVPKQKQSIAHDQAPVAAQDQRAVGERIPAVPSAPAPAPGVPALRHVRRPRGRRRDVARPRPRALALRAVPEPVTVAVDANGADKGPAEVARGAALAARRAGARVLLFGPAAELGEVPAGVEIVDAPLSIAKAADPARAVRGNPGRVDRPGRRGRRRRPRRRARVRRLDRGRPRRRRCSPSSAPAACTGRRWRSSCRSRARRSCCSTPAPTSRCGRSTSCSSRTWARRSWRS